MIAGALFAATLVGAAASYADLVRDGQARHDAFDLPGALSACQEAHALETTGFEALACLAHIHNDIGVNAPRNEQPPHFVKGMALSAEMQRRYPNEAIAHLWAAASAGNLALLRGGKEKVRLARDFEKNSQRAIALDPSLAAAYVGLGIYYREVASLGWFLRKFAAIFAGGLPRGTKEDSARMLEKAVALAPKDVFANYQLALTYEALDRKRDAARQYRIALEQPVVEVRDNANKAEARRRLAVIDHE